MQSTPTYTPADAVVEGSCATDPTSDSEQEPQVKEAAAAPVEAAPETNGAHVVPPAENGEIEHPVPVSVEEVEPLQPEIETEASPTAEAADAEEKDAAFVGVEEISAAPANDSSALFGAPASGEDPFAGVGRQGAEDPLSQNNNQQPPAAADPGAPEPVQAEAQQQQEPAIEPAASYVTSQVDIAAPPQDDTHALFGGSAPSEFDFGGSAPSEFDAVAAPFAAPSVDVQTAEQESGTEVVDLGSPMKDPSALFGESGSGSNDFFSSLAPPAEDHFEVCMYVDFKSDKDYV